MAPHMHGLRETSWKVNRWVLEKGDSKRENQVTEGNFHSYLSPPIWENRREDSLEDSCLAQGQGKNTRYPSLDDQVQIHWFPHSEDSNFICIRKLSSDDSESTFSKIYLFYFICIGIMSVYYMLALEARRGCETLWSWSNWQLWCLM